MFACLQSQTSAVVRICFRPWARIVVVLSSWHPWHDGPFFGGLVTLGGEGKPAANFDSAPVRDHIVDEGRPQPYRHVGPQARRSCGIPWRVWRAANQCARHSAFRHAAAPAGGLWINGRLSAACTTTTWAIPRVTRFGFTGYPSGPNPDENLYPSCGSIVSRQLEHQNTHLPAYVMIPRNVPGTGAGYLGMAHHRRSRPESIRLSLVLFRIPNFTFPSGVTLEQVGDRAGLLSSFDTIRRDIDNTGQLGALDRYGQQAWSILTSTAAQNAFDLDSEPTTFADAMGFMPAYDPGATNRCGVSSLESAHLACPPLGEAGVRLVNVDLRWWDTHVFGL